MNRLLKFKEFSEFLTRELRLTEMMSLDQELGLYDDIMEGGSDELLVTTIDDIYSQEEAENCGGAFGHILHPFEDMDLTMADIHQMIQITVNGSFSSDNFVQSKCLSPDTLVTLKENGNKTIKEIVDNKLSDMALSFNEVTNEIEYAEILNWVKNESSNEWLEIVLENGNIITVTPNHRIFVPGKGDVMANGLEVGVELITV